ncbi:MAG: tRNA (guanosine(37)-N1)-methyltransferase TrmD [Alphaproteobacteria bacterium]|nr:tRNA (guanosine(37)-N1)-methyltransferase TrmD [Alphaproteobacteria bacterium]MCK5659412.1 tRNA (guanosine(37)-N1)-methyltransferase TrmD [Alphaproteobacteria bacterium]
MTSPFHIKILTLFPEMFPGMIGMSLSGKALEKGIWSFETIQLRDYTKDIHKTVDDTPFGGGAGMVIKPDILDKALCDHQPLGRFIYMSPRGKPLTQSLAHKLVKEPLLTILCGRYEGVDQRLLDSYEVEEISVGDYVLSGGEPAAMILLDSCIRLLPDVLGNAETHTEESFENGLLEYPHYTRPAEWIDSAGITRKVPEVLVSGHHAKVAAWRQSESEAITKVKRPDLWKKYIRSKA